MSEIRNVHHLLKVAMHRLTELNVYRASDCCRSCSSSCVMSRNCWSSSCTRDDYKQHVTQWCPYDPQLLAAMTGMLLKHAGMTSTRHHTVLSGSVTHLSQLKHESLSFVLNAFSAASFSQSMCLDVYSN